MGTQQIFAVQVLYCQDSLMFHSSFLNVNGSAISIGRSYGMSGGARSATR